ncbi:unnamed protein product [Litomosoides sigmodontis]|uniref:Uncharacterized protein n=1 Tax=Litomosoides sigmodontis TaxID=42156 RepID=A0A3P6TEH8_LITSI|nr:unnamed protein product [Litomosoides sigmodontis]
MILRISHVICQVDLGSFSLGQNKRGDLKFIFNQAANILGFGGDRGIDLTIGDGLFNAKARHGALIAGERVGADSGFRVNEAEGVDFGNFLNFGNSPLSFNNPAGLFLSFLEKLNQFFTSTSKNKSSHAIRPSTSYDNQDVEAGNIFPSLETSGQQRISGETVNYRQSENDDYDAYYHSSEVDDGILQRKFRTTADEFSGEENRTVLNQDIVESEFNATTI